LLWLTKEGVGETSGQRSDRFSKETGPAEETDFLRSCGFLAPAISPGLRSQVKSGPDVFADALVPVAPDGPGRFESPKVPLLRFAQTQPVAWKSNGRRNDGTDTSLMRIAKQAFTRTACLPVFSPLYFARGSRGLERSMERL
jgi:hypothetical protein